MLAQALLFLLETIVSFLSVVLLLRFHMQLFRVSFNNQLGVFVVELTNWLVKPLRRVMPGLWGLDLASLLPVIVLQAVLIFASLSVHAGLDVWAQGASGLLLIWRALMATVRMSLYLLIGALIVQAVLSWINPYNPVSQPLGQLTGPFLRPIQRLLPPIGSIDLSPLIAIVLAQLLLMFL
ncbi:MAG TPA: YggT family protein [Accumulibacter sp.]|nr:YggT family protein [Accumulibacter sp.]HMW16303.1 YggT family protein [Accumulibacter sp.]HMX22557.1 YggT family protein [Accumulibacter sp.]HMY05713.1 YggT family protein [Accumulibacter sp.]HNC16934.1 YggT family protein [Accumulibacter sp.]